MNPSNGYITADLWGLVSQEIMKQCDALDGLVDGIISEPDHCQPNFQNLICKHPIHLFPCLNEAQFNALEKIYSPINGSDGNKIVSRFDPGAESGGAWLVLFSGQVVAYASVSALILLFLLLF